MKNTSETVKCEKLSLDFIGDNCAELNPYGYLLRFGGGNSSREEYDPIDVSRAQFIVTACNAHDVLLKGHKLILQHMQEIAEDGQPMTWAQAEDIMKIAKHAISLATTT